ncbi:hypothetical protein MDA_GLEAN10000524 [Myotis davidii]|uniref:Uncharacterized protein n=1 Tax=Myotis davidii TaxID=225400 RepID=L5LYA6_MYODS|nr:hypothetical protein MDA_GLEAN10000524 [Myotis davidii]
MSGRTIRVRPYPFLEARSIFSNQEVSESFDGKTEQPSNLLDCQGSKVTTPPPNLVETISTTPPADPIEFRTATPSPVLKRGSEGSLAMRKSRSSSTFSSRGTAHELGLHTG